MSPLRKRLIVAFVSFTLVAVTLVHLPWLPVSWQAVGHAFANLIGQEHRWTMFSADPRTASPDLWAELTLVDETTLVWRIDKQGFGGDLGYYHWVKWMETAVLAEPEDDLGSFARWLSTLHPETVRVVIYGSITAGFPPGQARPDPEVVVLFSANAAELAGEG